MQKKNGREIGHKTKNRFFFQEKGEIRDESQNFIVPLCTQHISNITNDGNHSSISTDHRGAC